MKANVILGKKQIVIAALVLILGAAVYLNWQFADIPATTTGGEGERRYNRRRRVGDGR